MSTLAYRLAYLVIAEAGDDPTDLDIVQTLEHVLGQACGTGGEGMDPAAFDVLCYDVEDAIREIDGDLHDDFEDPGADDDTADDGSEGRGVPAYIPSFGI